MASAITPPLEYEQVINSVHDVVFQTDEVGNWIFLNHSWERIMQYRIEESLGKPFFNFLFPEDVKRNAELFAPLVSGEKKYCNHEIRYVRKDGSIIWMNVYAVLALNNQGKVIGTAGTLSDITIEKQNKQFLELISKNSDELVLIMNPSFKTVYTSANVKNNFGEFLLQDDFKKIFINEDEFNKFRHKVLSVYTGRYKEIGTIEIQFVALDETPKWYETKVIGTYNQNGTINYIIFLGKRIEEKKILELQIKNSLQHERQLNIMKSNFVSLVSHEFKNPLSTIKSSAELIGLYLNKKNPQTEKKIQNHLEIIDKEIDRIADIVTNILMLGLIDSGNVQLKMKMVNLEEEINRIIDRTIFNNESERKIKFINKCKLKEFYTDEKILGHILENLISNALKYSNKANNPEITICINNYRLEVKVKDYGIGIPKADQHYLFTSFYRASNVDNISGTGLGLFIVKKFVEYLQGSITFTSKEQKGTEFVLLLPIIKS